MQANYEEDKLIVSATEPTGENRKRVWFQTRVKNLLNINKCIAMLCTANFDNSANSLIVTVNNQAWAHLQFKNIKVKPKTHYCLSYAGAEFVNISVSSGNNDASNTFVEKANPGQLFKFDTPENCNEITLFLNVSLEKAISGTYAYTNLMLEEGTEPTEYEPYVEPKIYILNNNGEYEEFIQKEETTLWEGTNSQSLWLSLNDNPDNYRFLKITTSQGYVALVPPCLGGSAGMGRTTIENNAYVVYSSFIKIEGYNNNDKTIKFSPCYHFKNGSINTGSAENAITKIVGIK